MVSISFVRFVFLNALIVLEYKAVFSVHKFLEIVWALGGASWRRRSINITLVGLISRLINTLSIQIVIHSFRFLILIHRLRIPFFWV